MSLSDDLPPPRRPLFFPVVIATTFLSIIGISAGILLANERDRREALNPVNNTPAIVDSPAAPDPSPSLDGEPCRPETLDAAANAGYPGPLVIVLHLRTKSSDVYICRDASDQLFYHADNGGEDQWIEGETALFLAGVERRSDDYLATANDGTTLSVTKKRLVVTHRDGGKETQAAIG
ncbi:hypothetical protein [Actinoplanes sp. NBRC 103695]|uniref:hypothetical protein n=1 Tax=Actinoplanes sp. NBRC 103695 TaxID=3032202 RepID=UPI0024A59D81|nr:hypothetical protein [Actinoplanes sp. NBRC 103695]GLY96813.1 hypothetical protein Acsp02_40670 [Actinoplanes sp. NBRC 103695]